MVGEVSTQDRSYELLRTIGTGGMAQVYEAIARSSSGFERKVAIKRILPDLLDDDRTRESFLQEAKLASRLHHANIVQVFDWGLIDGNEFIAMEYVEGIDASGAARRAARMDQPMTEDVGLYIIAEIASALDYLHTFVDVHGHPANIIHRDISPQNILLSWDGGIKLSDFGIALTDRRDVRTATGVVKGKTSYMAPEQARAKTLTPAADIYALGATLHALLTGHPPIGSAEELIRLLRGAPLELDSMLSTEVAELIHRCMQFEAEDRPSASEVAEQAGSMAAKLLTRSGRAVLHDFLTTVHPVVESTNALDLVMGVCFVPVGNGAFTVTHSAGPATLTQGAPPDPGSEPGATQPELVPLGNEGAGFRKSGGTTLRLGSAQADVPADDGAVGSREKPSTKLFGRRRMAIAGILVVLVFGGVGLRWFATDGLRANGSDHRIDSDGGRFPMVLPSTDAGLFIPLDAHVIVIADAGLVDAGVSRDAGHVQPIHGLDSRLRRWEELHGRIKRDSGRPVPNDAPPPSSVPTSGDPGWIRVGGPALAGGRVLIDGRQVGHAPFETRLSPGSHRLVVQNGNETLVSTAVHITSENTRRNPVRVIR